jgi:hypothetical protein
VAIVLVYRVAVALSPVAYRVLRASEGPGLDTTFRLAPALERRLHDPAESDAVLSTVLSEATGRLVDVATFTGSFETRRLQVHFSFNGGTGSSDDVRVITFHHVKLASGAPSDSWVAGDFETMETAFDAFWNSLKTRQRNTLTLIQYRWYKAGPSILPPQERSSIATLDSRSRRCVRSTET